MTILIKHAQIVDGSGRPPYKADVFVRGDTISSIGDLKRQSADVVISAPNFHVSPGFIDANTDSDHYLTLFSNPEQQDFLLQGVTTIIGGFCGASLAPLLYGGLESIRKWTDINQINVDWHSVAEFLKVLDRRKIGVNFATLVGHSTIRRALIGEELRDLTLGELEVFEKIVADALKEGAFGLSSGLGYVHARGTPLSELKQLVRIVAEKNGVYATHLRDEKGGLLASLNETINLAKTTEVSALISHLRPLKGFEAEYEEGLELLEKSAVEADVHFDLYPFDASHVTIYSFLPLWAQSGNMEAMLKNLKNPSLRKKIVKEMNVGDGDEIQIVWAGAANYFVGKTLRECAEKRGVSPAECLLAIMEATQLRATALYKNIDYDLLKRALGHGRALIASNAASFKKGIFKPERSEKTFLRFLELAVKDKIMSLEEAIQKITMAPARKFNLQRRGLVKEGNYADLVVFLADPAVGAEIKHVIVNGKLAVKDAQLVNGTSGFALRRV